MGDSTTTTQARANTAPDDDRHDTDERREHLAIERAFVLRGLRELVENTAPQSQEPSC